MANTSVVNNHLGHCNCPLVVMGHHLIKTCRIIMVQQVNSKDGSGPLFILRVEGIPPGDTIFVRQEEVESLMKTFGIHSKLLVNERPSSRPNSKTSYRGDDGDPW